MPFQNSLITLHITFFFDSFQSGYVNDRGFRARVFVILQLKLEFNSKIGDRHTCSP